MAITARIFKLLFNYDWEIIEIQGATFKILWGFWLLLPFKTFRAIEGYFAAGGENYWGWGLLALGALHFAAIITNYNISFSIGRRTYKINSRRWLTFIAFLFWAFTAVLIWQQSNTSALLPFFALIAFFMILNFFRLGIQMQAEDMLDQRKVNLGSPAGVAERRSK